MIRVRASVSLGELAEGRRAKLPEARPEKPCRYCGGSWRPLSGMAEKIRQHCYGTACESRHEAHRNSRRRERYRIAIKNLP